MVIEINDKIKEIINNVTAHSDSSKLGNITRKKAALKIYSALYVMSRRKNRHGWFAIPATYMKSINNRYHTVIDYFIEAGLIEYLSRKEFDSNSIFDTVEKKYYDPTNGKCMKYRFLMDTNGQQVNIDMITHKDYRWYELIQDSLFKAGFQDVKISRDTFGRRVHHSAIRDYKKDFKGYYTIDAVSSQPRLLYLEMKKNGIVDINLSDIFQNDKDFYRELQYKLDIANRDDAKELFMFWVNSNGYVPNFKIHLLFPTASNFIKKNKGNNYKDFASKLQRIESKIFIDDIMNNIPCDFALPVHDSVIVEEKDADRIYAWIKGKYPELKFKKEKI